MPGPSPTRMMPAFSSADWRGIHRCNTREHTLEESSPFLTVRQPLIPKTQTRWLLRLYLPKDIYNKKNITIVLKIGLLSNPQFFRHGATLLAKVIVQTHIYCNTQKGVIYQQFASLRQWFAMPHSPLTLCFITKDARELFFFYIWSNYSTSVQHVRLFQLYRSIGLWSTESMHTVSLSIIRVAVGIELFLSNLYYIMALIIIKCNNNNKAINNH